MKKIPLNLTLLMILMTVVTSNMMISQYIMANNIDNEKSNTFYNTQTTKNYYVSIYSDSQQQYHDSFDWSMPSTSSKITDVLTASFTNIIDTQIYTGLEK